MTPAPCVCCGLPSWRPGVRLFPLDLGPVLGSLPGDPADETVECLDDPSQAVAS